MVSPFLVPYFRHHWLKPLPSSVSLDLQPSSCRSRGDSRLKYLVSGLLFSFTLCSLLTRSCDAPSLDEFRRFVIITDVLLRADERPGRIHSLAINRTGPFLRANWLCRRRSGLPDIPTHPPLVLLIPSPSVDLYGAYHYNATAQFAVILGDAWLAKPRAYIDNVYTLIFKFNGDFFWSTGNHSNIWYVVTFSFTNKFHLPFR